MERAAAGISAREPARRFKREKGGLELETVYFDTRDRFAQWALDDALLKLIRKTKKEYSEIVIVCIGTDRSTGDSYGPLTGHLLSRVPRPAFRLFGTFEKPVHALTLADTLTQFNAARALVIAVDASVGSTGYVGFVGVTAGPVRPGSGLGKELPPVGDISITGIAAEGGLSPFMMLQNAPLGMVYNMAEKTFHALHLALLRLSHENAKEAPPAPFIQLA